MDLMQLRSVQWITIIAAIVSIVSGFALWDSPYRVYCIVACILLFAVLFVLELQKDRLSVLFAGISKFYQVFPQEQNRLVFEQVKKEYWYLGVSFTSVMNSFREWYETERRAGCKVRLLLTDPEATGVLEFQARHEHKLFKEVTLEEAELLRDTVRRVQQGITLTLDLLATLPGASECIEVRFHRQNLRTWSHMVDNEVLYVGFLRQGESGLRAPVVLLRSRPGKWSLFEHYSEEIETIWSTASPARQISVKR